MTDRVSPERVFVGGEPGDPGHVGETARDVGETARAEAEARGSRADIVFDAARRPIVPGRSLFEEAADLAAAVPSSCRQSGRCRECVVQVLGGESSLSSRTPAEEHLPHGFRLACQAIVERSDQDVEFAVLRRRLRILGPSQFPAVAPDRIDPAVTRDGDLVRYLGAPFDGYQGAIVGLALDIGTTSVVAQLVDLETGAVLTSFAFENPQRFGGSDVITRIAYETLRPGELRRALRRMLNRELAAAFHSLGLDRHAVIEAIVVGNPTMRDLFFGLPVAPLGELPFRSTTEIAVREGREPSSAVERVGHELGLLIHPRGRVIGAPLVGSHVGADLAADLVATGFDGLTGGSLLLDIGTNTEIVASDGRRIVAASSPAGPAFEGGGISRGMVAVDGAIEAVRWMGDRFAWRTIGATEPEGICGSGLIDLLGAAREAGFVREDGTFAGVAASIDVVPERRIGLTRADVSALLQAKAATTAGIWILLRRLGLQRDGLDRLILAGGFANSLDVEHATAIGLLPPVPTDRVVRAGNAAARGARDLLLSTTRRAELETLVGRIEHVELEAERDFFDLFVDGMRLAPMGVDSRQPAPARLSARPAPSPARGGKDRDPPRRAGP